jgi:hypothetical protein
MVAAGRCRRRITFEDIDHADFRGYVGVGRLKFRLANAHGGELSLALESAVSVVKHQENVAIARLSDAFLPRVSVGGYARLLLDPDFVKIGLKRRGGFDLLLQFEAEIGQSDALLAPQRKAVVASARNHYPDLRRFRQKLPLNRPFWGLEFRPREHHRRTAKPPLRFQPSG